MPVASGRAFLLAYSASDEGNGSAALGEINSARFVGNHLDGLTVTPNRFYMEAPETRRSRSDSFLGNPLGGQPPLRPADVGVSQMTAIDSGPGWSLSEMPTSRVTVKVQ